MEEFKKKDAENLIDKKIQDAKLDRYEEQVNISKDQLNFFFKIGGSLIAVFGLFIPILISFINTEKVNDAISSMEQRVERLLNQQLRKPSIIGIFNGHEIKDNFSLNYYFKIDKEKRVLADEKGHVLKILNNGDAPAKELRIFFYLKSDSLINPKYQYKDKKWIKWRYSDEEDYSYSSIYTGGDNQAIVIILDASEYIPIEIDHNIFNWENRNIHEFDALIKVHYGAPSPYLIPFKIKFIEDKDNL